MIYPIHRIDVLASGTIVVGNIIEPVPPPMPQSQPVVCWKPGVGDWPHRGRLDVVPRTLTEGFITNPTNAVERFCPVSGDGTKVDNSGSPIVMTMRKRRDWLNWIKYTNGAVAAEKIYWNGVCCFDGPNDPIDEQTPGNPYHLLLMQGNNVNVRTSDNKWAYCETMDYRQPAQLDKTWYNSLVVIKVSQIGHRNRDGSTIFRTDVKWSDIYYPNCCYEIYPWVSSIPMAAIELSKLEPYPSTPFHCTLYGRTVTISDYCISGDKTWGYVTWGELETGWYLLEEMLPTGDISGRRVYVSPWLATPPVPVAGWTRQE